MAQFKKKRKRKRDTKRVTRIVAVLIVFGLIAAFFIGSIGTVSAQAATHSPATVSCVPDIDADGELNAVDSDIDGDGIVNGADPDIDGDGVANGSDSDPAATNGETPGSKKSDVGGTVPLPRLIPTELDTPLGRAAITLVILGSGAAVIIARRKHK